MLKLVNVSKTYKHKFIALKDFAIQFENGITGLLGANGAGKTTLMRIMTTVIKPSHGEITCDGSNIFKDSTDFRKILGYLPQEFNIMPTLTPIEFLNYMAAIKGIHKKVSSNRIEELLNAFNLYEYRNKQIGEFSGGMRQRVGLAQALLNDPRVLIIDEPTVGLDSYEKVNFRNLLSSLSEDRIIILSTHIVSDIDNTASSIAIMRKGCLLEHLRPSELLNLAKGKIWSTTIENSQLDSFKKQYTVVNSLKKDDGFEIKFISEASNVQNALVTEPTLEDAYLYILQKEKQNEY